MTIADNSQVCNLFIKRIAVQTVTIILIFACNGKALAQWTMGGRNIAMAQANTALSTDTWAIFHNPALISDSRSELGFFAIRYYGIKELEDHAAVITLPVRIPRISELVPFGLSAGIHSYGFDLYRETQIRGGWSRRISRIRAGMAFKYVHTRISGFGSTGKPLWDAGLTAELIQDIQIGYRITNVFQTGSGEYDHYPSEIAAGISWSGISGLILAGDIVKDMMHPLSMRFAMEIEGTEGVFLRGGWTGNPFTWSAGAGLHRSWLQINLAVQKHPVLGLSPGIDCAVFI